MNIAHTLVLLPVTELQSRSYKDRLLQEIQILLGTAHKSADHTWQRVFLDDAIVRILNV